MAKKPKEKKPINKKLAILAIVIVGITVSGLVLSWVFLSTPEAEFPLTAAIVDQIGGNIPSDAGSAKAFNETVTHLLQSAGFAVYYYGNQTVTVDFYRNLAKNNYGLIILRGHAALRKGETVVDFFTSEVFVEGKYNHELNDGLLAEGRYDWEPNKSYFTITPKFIENLESSFPKSIIVSMGCWSLALDYGEMAQAFIKKGATAYIGYTDALSMQYSDNSTIRFLQYFLANETTVAQAAYECNKFYDPEQGYVQGKLSLYPTEIAFTPSGISDYKLSNFTAKTLTDFIIALPAVSIACKHLTRNY